MGVIYGALGDRARTLEGLDERVQRRLFAKGPLLGNAAWGFVRTDPRFEPLLAKAGLQ